MKDMYTCLLILTIQTKSRMDQQLVSLLYPTSYTVRYNHHRMQQNSEPNATLESHTVCYLDKCPDPVLDRKRIVSTSCNQCETLCHNIVYRQSLFPVPVFIESSCNENLTRAIHNQNVLTI
jgi:hypothetical protein